MNADQTLARIRSLAHLYALDAADQTGADLLARAFHELDAHLSAGGTPPEAWREGLDAPGAARYWTMPADPEAGHPEPYGASTWGIVDEEAGGVIAWVMDGATADTLADRLNR